MKFIHRVGYYLVGFVIGLILLIFFLGGKRASCDYSPDARVLKNIRIKERAYSATALQTLSEKQIDTAAVTRILHKGDVDFGRSNTSLDSCKTYLVTGNSAQHSLELLFENCDSIATLLEVQVIE